MTRDIKSPYHLCGTQHILGVGFTLALSELQGCLTQVIAYGDARTRGDQHLHSATVALLSSPMHWSGAIAILDIDTGLGVDQHLREQRNALASSHRYPVYRDWPWRPPVPAQHHCGRSELRSGGG